MLNKIILTIFLLLVVLIFNSCGKHEVNSITKLSIESHSKFFTNNRTQDMGEAALVDFIKRQDEQKHFVERTVSQIGYPYWDKSIKLIRPATNVAGRNGNESTEIIYVPFVKDSQNYVNAAMIINVQPGKDTSFTYACDWQYYQLKSDNANNYAVFFMQLNKIVFGYSEFIITNKHLFTPKSNPNKHNTSQYSTRIQFSDGSSNFNTGSNRLLELECYDIIITYVCAVCKGNDPQCPLGGTWVEYETVCGWIDYPGEGPGGDPGGGGNGQPTEPCTPQPIQGRNEPGNGVGCPPGPGWIPQPFIPCDPYVQALSANQNFINIMRYLNSSPVLGLSYEIGYDIRNVNQYNPSTYIQKLGTPGQPTIDWNLPANTLSDGFVHSHYAGLNSIFTPEDIIFMAQVFITGHSRDTNNLFFAVTSNYAMPMMVKVGNVAVFRSFCEKIVGTNGFDTDKMRIFAEKFYEKINSDNPDTNEKEFLKLINSYEAQNGLKLYMGNSDCTNWTQRTIDSFGKVLSVTCTGSAE